MLIGIFEKCMKRRCVKESDPFDWEKIPTGDNATTISSTTQAQPPTAPSTLPRNTKHPTTDNNQENIEPTDNKDTQLESRKKRIETENTAPLVTDTQTNVPRPVVDKNCNATAVEQVQQSTCLFSSVLSFLILLLPTNFRFLSVPKRRATSHLEQPPERLDNETAASAKSTSDNNQKPAPLRKSQSGVATLGRLRVAPSQQGGNVVESPATPEFERPRRRQPSAARSARSGARDQSLTQFAVIDDENVSQQVCIHILLVLS